MIANGITVADSSEAQQKQSGNLAEPVKGQAFVVDDKGELLKGIKPGSAVLVIPPDISARHLNERKGKDGKPAPGAYWFRAEFPAVVSVDGGVKATLETKGGMRGSSGPLSFNLSAVKA